MKRMTVLALALASMLALPAAFASAQTTKPASYQQAGQAGR